MFSEKVFKMEALAELRPKIHENVNPKYPTLNDPRITLDRCTFTVYSDEIHKQIDEWKRNNSIPKGSETYRKDVYQKWEHFKCRTEDKRGHTSGLQFPLENFEGENIAWMQISMREPHMAIVYVNMLKYYRKKQNIKKPNYGFHDTNFLPVDYTDNKQLLKDFAHLYYISCLEIRREYQKLIKKLFNYELTKIDVTPKSIEIPCEYLHRDVMEYEWLSDVAKCKSVVKHSDLTRTMYFNKNSKKIKSQLKFYQKAPGICRMEITLHKNFASDYLKLSTPEMLEQHILCAIHDVLKLYGLSLDKITPFKLNHEDLLTQFALAFNLEKDYLKFLIYGNIGEMTFDKDNQGLRNKLLKRGLIEKGQKGCLRKNRYD